MTEEKLRFDGQITVYAALSFMLVISLIAACIRSALYSGTLLEVEISSRLAIESAFAAYHKDLLEEFDVFALDKERIGEEILFQTAKTNIKGLCSENAVQFVNAQMKDCVSMTDFGGVGLEYQVVSYMNIGIYSDILRNIFDIETESKRAEKVSEVTEQIIACEEELLQLDEIILEVISLVEGIQTNAYGIVVRNKKAVPTNKYFAKAILTAPLTMQTAAIDTKQVYAAVSANGTKYVNVNEIFDSMKECVETYRSCMKEGNAGSKEVAADCLRYYKSSLELLQDAVSSVIEQSGEALEKLKNYDKQFASCDSRLKQCIQTVEQNKELLGEELYQALKPDIEEIAQNPNALGKSMCTTAFLKVGLQTNLDILKRAKQTISELDNTITDQNSGMLLEKIESSRGQFQGISNRLLKFNYSGIEFSGAGEGLKIIETIKNTLSDGICGLVLGEQKVSDGKISYTDLASSCMDASAEIPSESNVLEQSKRKLLFDQYVLQRFPCCIDSFSEQDGQNTDVSKDADEEEKWCALQYPLEYILCGKTSDKENLNEVILKISVIREGINLTHLITDRKKKNEAFALASKLVGYTGNTVIVKAAQYVIMGVWAYGESICDIKKLLNKESVALIKTDKTWQLSLDKLLTMNFESDAKEQESKGEGDLGGLLKSELTYKDYLAMLLLAQNAKQKRFRVMDIMELRMIALGDGTFRMKDYIWDATAQITVKMKESGEYYVRKVAYCYV